MRSRSVSGWAVVAALAIGCSISAAVIAPSARPAERPATDRPLTFGLASTLADSVAKALVGLPPAKRMAEWQRTQLGREHALAVSVADTLGDDMLIAVQEFGTQELALRLVERDSWRAVFNGVVRSEGEDENENRLLEQVVLGRARGGLGRHIGRVALLWFEEAGSAAPHTLWTAPVDTVPHRRFQLRKLPIKQTGWDGGGGLMTLRKRDEILVQIRSTWSGTATFDANFCGACTHLTMLSVWRVNSEGAVQLRAQPLDDAAFAVARAFDGHRHYDGWSTADLSVAPSVDAWLERQEAVTIEFALPLGGDDARVRLWGLSPIGTEPQRQTLPPDSLGIVVRRIGTGAAARWTLQ